MYNDTTATEGWGEGQMTIAAANPEREAVQALEARLEEFKERLVDELQAIDNGEAAMDPEFVGRFRETASRLARQLNQSLPVSFPPEAGDEVRRTAIDALTEAMEFDESRPLDALDRLMLRLEQIRHLLRDAVDESLAASDGDGRAYAEKLVSWLPGVSAAEIARLAGTSPRSLQRLRKDGGVASSQLELLTRLVVILRRAWTPDGVIAWFERPRKGLGSRRPAELLSSPELEQELLTEARQGRAGHGS